MYGPLVKGESWQQNWTNKDGRWVTAAEGPIFFACMIILFLTLGVVLTLEGLSVIRSGISDNQSSRQHQVLGKERSYMRKRLVLPQR